MPSPCRLNIYDVSTNPEVEKLNEYLTAVGTGAFHGGVEVYGKEYSFGYCVQGSGIFHNAPKGCTLHHFREGIDLGECTKSEDEVNQLVEEMKPEWPGGEYDLIRRNCVVFSAEFARRLGVQPVPKWVTNLAGAGATIQDGAMQAATTAQATAIMAAAKAGEINAKYDISGTAAAKVSDMLVAAGELDEKYQIKKKAGEAVTKGIQGAQVAVQTAQELDEKYKIKEQVHAVAVKGGEMVVEGAKAAATKVQDLDEQYHIRENAAAAAVKGGQMAVDGAQAAAAKAQELDEKYHIKENAAAAALKGGQMAVDGAKHVVFKVGEIAEKHQVKEKLADLREKAKVQIHELDEKHHITAKMQENGCGACTECVVQ